MEKWYAVMEEEVADYIHDGKYKEAEEIIDAFMF